MFFLIRMAFWLSVVLVLLPSGGGKQTAPGAEIGASEAVSVASATVSDMRQFCARQPEACALGSQAAVAFGHRAQAGAKMVYELISERAAPRVTGSIANAGTKPVTSAVKSSQNTLTAADLAPTWRGPRRDAHNQHGA
jgi:uncharacterized protein DUF5330